MSAIVDFTFYSTVYKGSEATEASFPALCARAEDVVGAMTRWAVRFDTIATFPAWVQGLYKTAICAQVDALAINGTESVIVQGGAGGGFTVGKVTVQAKASAAAAGAGAMSTAISPMAVAYLEQTGLLNPQVETAPDMPAIGWWF